MAGFKVDATIKDKGIAKKLSALEGKMKNMTGFHKNVGEYWHGSMLQNFANESGPDGSKWPALSPVTIRARLRRGGNAGITMLREKGDLIGSYNYRASSSQVALGSPLVYARIQNEGGQAGRNRSVTIPARPHVGIGPKDEQAILEIAEDYVALGR